MKISYKKLWILLIEKDISPATLRKDLNIATGTMILSISLDTFSTQNSKQVRNPLFEMEKI